MLDQRKYKLYKTELCRNWQEMGICRYAKKCRFAHGHEELRCVKRHAKYKTDICKTFHETGTCSYGVRCNFIHDEPSTAAVDKSVNTNATILSAMAAPFVFTGLTTNGLSFSPTHANHLNVAPSVSSVSSASTTPPTSPLFTTEDRSKDAHKRNSLSILDQPASPIRTNTESTALFMSIMNSYRLFEGKDEAHEIDLANRNIFDPIFYSSRPAPKTMWAAPTDQQATNANQDTIAASASTLQQQQKSSQHPFINASAYYTTSSHSNHSKNIWELPRITTTTSSISPFSFQRETNDMFMPFASLSASSTTAIVTSPV